MHFCTVSRPSSVFRDELHELVCGGVQHQRLMELSCESLQGAINLYK